MAFKMKKGSPMERNFGISPMKNKNKTRTIDKVKAGLKAAKAGLYADSSSRDSNVISTVSRAYKREKEKYRDIQANKKK